LTSSERKGLREAIRISPDDPDSYIRIGILYGELGQWQEALETGKKLRQMLPDHEVGYWLMSSAYAELERYAEAIEVTEANLRHHPNSQPATEGLGYIFLKSGRFADAIPVYVRAIAAHAGAANLHAQLAEAYLGVGDIAAAAEQQTNCKNAFEQSRRMLGRRTHRARLPQFHFV
jgi:tetratricopeptide (TPR) repeat protein